MNFKRPCWIALFITLGMMLVGYIGFLTTKWNPKGAETWWISLTGIGSYFLMILGVFGSVVFLIWCLVEAIASRNHSNDPQN
jgi:hypothetical protein